MEYTIDTLEKLQQDNPDMQLADGDSIVFPYKDVLELITTCCRCGLKHEIDIEFFGFLRPKMRWTFNLVQD